MKRVTKEAVSNGISTHTKVLISRILFLSILCLIAAVSSYTAFEALTESENELALSHFDSIVKHAVTAARGAIYRQTYGAATLASMYASNFPDASQWPLVYLEDFETTSFDLIEASSTSEVTFAPFVTPDQLSLFERMAYEKFYQKGFPASTGMSGFGAGVWAPSAGPLGALPNNRFHDVNGTTNFNSLYSSGVIAAFLQYSQGPHPTLMRNIHHDAIGGQPIDNVLNCSEERTRTGDLSNRCFVVSDIVHPPPGFTADETVLVVAPVYPSHNKTYTGGVVTSVVTLLTVVENMFNSEAVGIDVVIETQTDQITFSVQSGDVVVVKRGNGDFHDKKYTKFGETHPFLPEELLGASSVEYKMSVYPNADLFKEYSTSNPLIGLIGSVCIAVFISLLFILYDFFVRQEFQERSSILEAKRRFVRYISHEVRTPLNTVCMGLRAMQDEMEESMREQQQQLGRQGGAEANGEAQSNMECTSGVNSTGKLLETGESTTEAPKLPRSLPPINVHVDNMTNTVSRARVSSGSLKIVKSWLKLIEEISENATNAVNVLNDLLNYDKVRSGTLRLELSIVHIWSHIERTVREFQPQARKAKVKFELDIQVNPSIPSVVLTPANSVEKSNSTKLVVRSNVQSSLICRELCAIGDSVRLAQVLRNLMSNALKFTPEGGELKISASWMPPSADTSMRSQVFSYPDIDEESTSFGVGPGVDVGGGANRFILNDGTEAVFRTNGLLKLTVTDSGAGMSKEQVEKLFREGVQFNVNELQAGQGSGLGLFIAKGIVELHGGSLRVASEGLGKGSTFTLLIPLHHVPVGFLTASQTHFPQSESILSFPSDSNTAQDLDTNPVAVKAPSLNSATGSFSLPKTEGKGVLLTLAPSIEELHAQSGGETKLTSPMEQSATGAAHGTVSSPSTADTAAVTGNSSNSILHFLVVDDVASNRKMLIRLLRNKGHSYVEAKHGQEAIDCYQEAEATCTTSSLKENENNDEGDNICTEPMGASVKRSSTRRFDTILMDYEMPIMNGPTATKRLRELGCTCPIIGVTGNVLPEDVKLFKTHGADHVLGKPLRIDELEAFLRLRTQQATSTEGLNQSLVTNTTTDRSGGLLPAVADSAAVLHRSIRNMNSSTSSASSLVPSALSSSKRLSGRSASKQAPDVCMESPVANSRTVKLKPISPEIKPMFPSSSTKFTGGTGMDIGTNTGGFVIGNGAATIVPHDAPVEDEAIVRLPI